MKLTCDVEHRVDDTHARDRNDEANEALAIEIDEAVLVTHG
jgi:hypothetical protein